jgi:hypothetical protein
MGPETVERINELLDEVEEKVDWLVDKINGLLDSVPFWLDWAVSKFQELWDNAMEKLQEFWDLMTDILSNIGAPWDLNGAKDEWGDVGGPVADRATEAARAQSEVDFAWKGRAADRYALSLGDQKSALTAVRDKLTAQMGPALNDVASGLYTFYICVIGAIGVMIIGILTATGEAVSILGLPAVPPTVYAAVVGALAAIGYGINDLLGAARSAETTFQNIANETSDFGASDWPSAVI